MRGGMQVQEPVKAANLATSGEDRGVGNVSKRGKRSKGGERGVKLRVELDMCSKRGDVMGAIDLYDSAVKEGVRMGQHHYNVLLYLCSSAALGTVQPAKSGTNGKLGSASAESLWYSEDNDMHEDPVHDQESNKFNLFRLEETASGIPISDEIKEYART
jgi:proteinaceous RNase P